MSKVVAIRIKNVLPSIIGKTERSFFDIMDFTVEEIIPGLLIFIDFQKAFDSLEWNFLLTKDV